MARDADSRVLLGALVDLYGGLLTSRQEQILRQMVDEDFSISEIAQCENISRQGVFDAVSRAEKELMAIEEKLGLYGKHAKAREKLDCAIDMIKSGELKGAVDIIENVQEGLI